MAGLNLAQCADAARVLRPFTNGNRTFHGYELPTGWLLPPRLSSELNWGRAPQWVQEWVRSQANDADDLALFVVYSYATPIAWYWRDFGWWRPDVRYSPTTTRHQALLPSFGSGVTPTSQT